MFARGKSGWVGFDVGATSVKAAQVVRADGEYRIRGAAVVPRSQRWTAASVRDDRPASSADEIRTAASLCDHLAGGCAATLIPVGMCDLLQMDAPAAPRTPRRPGAGDDLLRNIEAESNRSMKDRVYDSWPVGAQAGRLNVVTAPRAWSDQMASDVAESGWQCRVVDALPWALARAATMAAGDSSAPIAALDWAYGKSTICLIQKGVPAFVRSLKGCSFQGVLDTIASGLRVNERDAEILLQKHGLQRAENAGGADVIGELLERSVTRLTNELRRTLEFWRGATRGQTPSAIYVFGGGGTICGVGQRLSERLSVPIKPWQIPIANSSDASWMPPACLLGVAAGLSALAWEAT